LEESLGSGELGVEVAAGGESVMADADEVLGQNVQQESPEELDGVECERSAATLFGMIPDGEGDTAVTHLDDAMVRQRDAVGVAAEVTEDDLRPAERGLGVDHPVLAVEAVLEGAPRGPVGESSGGAGERELTVYPGVMEGSEELAAEELGQDTDGEEEALAAVDPVFSIQGQTAPGDDAMQVGVELEVLTPGVEKRGEADLSTEVTRVGSDLVQCGRRRSEEGGEDHGLVA
jgi:hypothetical protein